MFALVAFVPIPLCSIFLRSVAGLYRGGGFVWFFCFVMPLFLTSCPSCIRGNGFSWVLIYGS